MISTLSRNRLRQHIMILSPLAVVGFGQIVIRLFVPIWGGWSWFPFWLVYILILIFFINLSGGDPQITKWLSPSSRPWVWAIVACGIPLMMTLPIFIPNWQLLIQPQILISTFLFLLLNPLFEEFYWRGALLDATTSWPHWLSAIYSALGFALHHLWIGVIAAAGRHPSALAGPLLMGFTWALCYRATGSLRWPILGHLLANLFSLSVPVFLNLYLPPGIGGG